MPNLDLPSRVASLPAGHRELLARRLIERLGRPPSGGHRRLAAYYTSPHSSDSPSVAELRRLLGENLPAHMIPAAFVPLDEFPVTPHGKVDRKALANRLASPARPTSTPTPSTADSGESRLLEIWREVLGNPSLGLHDDFFEAGGDSILAIQVISKASGAGFSLPLGEFFRVPTVAQMAEAVRDSLDPSTDETAQQAPSTNAAVPLTPIQQWFLEQEFASPHQWGLTEGLLIPADTSDDRVERALQVVIRRHHALRLVLVRKGGGWVQSVAGETPPIASSNCDLDGLSEVDRDETIRQEVARLHSTMQLDQGCLLRASRLKSWSSDGDLLVLAAHHLAIDAVSWTILLDDLVTALRSGGDDDSGLPKPTTSFDQWAHHLYRHAQSEAVRQQAAFWTAPSYQRAAPIPCDLGDNAPNTEESAETILHRFDADLTAQLTGEVLPAYRADLRLALLAAVAQGIARWSNQHTLLAGLEGHGREDLGGGTDLSRSVGWFTTYFPVLLETAPGADFEAVLTMVKERVREIPANGIGYGLLRYLTADAALTAELAGHPSPELIVNYLGQFPAQGDGSETYRRIDVPLAGARAGEARRASVFEINSWIRDDCLHLAWSFSRNLHRRETVERLVTSAADSLRSLLHRLDDGTSPQVSPSDFPDAGLSTDDLKNLFGGNA